MNDRDLILEVCHELVNRALANEAEAIGSEYCDAREKADAIRRLLDSHDAICSQRPCAWAVLGPGADLYDNKGDAVDTLVFYDEGEAKGFIEDSAIPLRHVALVPIDRAGALAPECDCPRRGPFEGSRCCSVRHRLPYASDEWCGCKCHDGTPMPLVNK